jgi:Ni/Fe-hydrogenase subunit HybB-like protein
MLHHLRPIKDMLWFLVFFGLLAGIFRLWFGLGATTNLSDEVPWGLWKILNMVAGVALSTSGFTVGLLVYVFKLKRFRPLAKPAILVALLGYGSSLLALLFDIGLPHRFWHPFVMWNENSFLFEVFWCVALYFTVTSIEFSPTIMERLRRHKLAHWLHRIAFGTVVLGISLSSLHHSSLGSLFLVTPLRLHPLWYSSLLPLFFILSAMGAGMMVLILIKILYARWYDPESVFGPQPIGPVCLIDNRQWGQNGERERGKDMPMLGALAAIAVALLAGYLLLKIFDLWRTDTWAALTAGTWESWVYSIELALTAVIPGILVVVPRIRRSPTGLGIVAFSAAAGLAFNRLNVGIFGYFRDAHTVYFPSLIEWSLGMGVVAGAALVFMFLVENISIFDERWKERGITVDTFRASFETFSRVWHMVLNDGLRRITLIGSLAIPLAWVMLYPPFHAGNAGADEVQPAIGLDAMRNVLRLDGNRKGVAVDFPHADHQQRLGGESSCGRCHHVSMPKDKSTPCSRCHRDMLYATRIFDHTLHVTAVATANNMTGYLPSNHACRLCHGAGLPKTGEQATACFACHQEDMWLVTQPDSTANRLRATPFQEAMHSNCITCHQQEKEKYNRPGLAECSTCHASLRARESTGPALAEVR